MDVFEIDDVLSLYLSGRARAWVQATYMSEVDRGRFVALCAKYPNVSITPNAVVIAQFFIQEYKVLLFPNVVRSATTELGVANWKMISIGETLTVHSTIPIGVVVGRIKSARPMKVKKEGDSFEIL